jgi:hypothetical protein
MHMLSCKEASALVSSAMDRRLSLGQRLDLWFHLAMCKYCRRFRKQLQIIRDMAKQYDAMLPPLMLSDQLSPEAHNRIINNLKIHFR